MQIDPGTAVSIAAKIWDFLTSWWKPKRSHGQTLVILPETLVALGRHQLWWSSAGISGQEGMQVVGDFYVTNASEQPILVTSATLKVWRRRFWVVPYRLKILGVVHVRSPNSRAFGSYSIPPNFTTDARAMWFPKPPFVMPGRYFMARACFVDQLGHEHWTRKLRWHSLSQTSQQ